MVAGGNGAPGQMPESLLDKLIDLVVKEDKDDDDDNGGDGEDATADNDDDHVAGEIDNAYGFMNGDASAMFAELKEMIEDHITKCAAWIESDGTYANGQDPERIYNHGSQVQVFACSLVWKQRQENGKR